MEVRTARFGTVEIDDDRVLSFPKGLLGFSGHTRFCLLQPSGDACFYWLQSLDDPSLVFVVTDPVIFVPEYSVPIRAEQMGDLSLERMEDAQVLVIVNKVNGVLTGNLQGPLVLNTARRVGEQFVLAEKKWTTRHEFVNLNERARAVSA